MDTRLRTAISLRTWMAGSVRANVKGLASDPYHMFSTCHQSLVDDFGGIVSTSIDVYAFLDDRV